jgi:hypothetical protein
MEDSLPSGFLTGGTIQETRSRHEDWVYIQDWLDAERTVFEGARNKPAVFYIYNPFTDQTETFMSADECRCSARGGYQLLAGWVAAG